MLFTGISRTFSTENEQQYETIGAFWSEMESKYDCTRLRGLGYNWTPGTIEYVIGLTEGFIEGANCTVMLPDEGWTEAKGRTEDLGHIYDVIYKNGALSYEIESFDPEGNCRILYSRSPEGYKKICRALVTDLDEILKLQYLAYQSEAALFGTDDIPPLKQTKEEVSEEYQKGSILKMVTEDGRIIGSVRAHAQDETAYIGKLMVHPDYRGCGLGSALLSEIERYFSGLRYELFTSTRSTDNIRLYRKAGYEIFCQRAVDDTLIFVYLEKNKPAPSSSHKMHKGVL